MKKICFFILCFILFSCSSNNEQVSKTTNIVEKQIELTNWIPGELPEKTLPINNSLWEF